VVDLFEGVGVEEVDLPTDGRHEEVVNVFLLGSESCVAAGVDMDHSFLLFKLDCMLGMQHTADYFAHFFNLETLFLGRTSRGWVDVSLLLKDRE